MNEVYTALIRRFLITGFFEDLPDGCDRTAVEAVLGGDAEQHSSKQGRFFLCFANGFIAQFRADERLLSLQVQTEINTYGEIRTWPKLAMMPGQGGRYVFLRQVQPDTV